MKKKPYAVVVGAGLGGMATALGLRNQGFEVEVFDRNPTLGGKIQEHREKGYRWDLGPSLMTMPSILEEWFHRVGRNLHDYLDLVPLPNTCRYFWQDGTKIDENPEFWKKPEIQEFMNYGKGIYEISGKAYLSYPPSDFWRAIGVQTILSLRHLPKLMTFKTLAQLIHSKVQDPYLRQIFERFATYNGSSPYKTPATFAIIPYVESFFGGWYLRGGMRKIVEAFEKLCKEAGVQFYLNETIISYENGIVCTESGITRRPDLLICNGEVIRSAKTWLKTKFTDQEREKLDRLQLSSSGYILLLGVEGENPALSHHNISFSQNYPREFQQIFDSRELPSDPTIYISITQRVDSEDAPPGNENWFILINTPAKSDFSEEEIQQYKEQVIRLLRERGLLLPSQKVNYEKVFHSRDLAHRDCSSHGALYGWASHTISSALFRPALQKKKEPIFFVGGSTHPGGGIPMVLLSAKMICEKIFRQFS